MTYITKRTCSYTLVTLCTLLFSVADVATAQDITKYYTVMHPEKFDIDWAEFYRTGDKLTATVRGSISNYLDLPYGDHSKQRLDLYLPKGNTKNAPVLVFFHGGGFREGNKAHYGYVAAPFVSQGIVVAVIGYRLTIDGFDVRTQSGDDWAEDAKRAIVWLYNHVEEYGGQRNAMYLAGHSTGGAIVTYLGIDRRWLSDFEIPVQSIRGIIRVSGGGGGVKSSPAHQAAARVEPNNPASTAVIAYGIKEASTHMQPAQDLSEKLVAAQVEVSFLALEGQNHADTAMSLGDEDSELVQSIIKMIKRES